MSFLQLLQNDRLSVFILALQLAFYVFEAMRGHLKLQLEVCLSNMAHGLWRLMKKNPFFPDVFDHVDERGLQ